MLIERAKKEFANGTVYALYTKDGYPLEVTDTFLPAYTKDAINEITNELKLKNLGSRKERWMIGVSCMSGCPIGCKFCATGNLKRYRNLTADEIVEQVEFIINKNPEFNPDECYEFKINYITLQVSLHSLDEERRHNLIPVKRLMSIEELGQIRTNSNLKTTVNMTLVDIADFDINKLKKYFNSEYFFIKLSPINENNISDKITWVRA